MNFAGQRMLVDQAAVRQATKHGGANGNSDKLASVRAPKASGGQASGLDALVGMIDSKEKNINAYQKTRLDWDRHTKQHELEDELEKNRKGGGYLGKQRFLDQVAAVEMANARQVEKFEQKLKEEKIKRM